MTHRKIIFTLIVPFLFLFALCSCATGFREHFRLTKDQVVELAKKEFKKAKVIKEVKTDRGYETEISTTKLDCDSLVLLFVTTFPAIGTYYTDSYFQVYCCDTANGLQVVGTYAIDPYGKGGNFRTPAWEGAHAVTPYPFDSRLLTEDKAIEQFEKHLFEEDGKKVKRQVCGIFPVHPKFGESLLDTANIFFGVVGIDWGWLVFSEDGTYHFMKQNGQIISSFVKHAEDIRGKEEGNEK